MRTRSKPPKNQQGVENLRKRLQIDRQRRREIERKEQTARTRLQNRLEYFRTKTKPLERDWAIRKQEAKPRKRLENWRTRSQPLERDYALTTRTCQARFTVRGRCDTGKRISLTSPQKANSKGPIRTNSQQGEPIQKGYSSWRSEPKGVFAGSKCL